MNAALSILDHSNARQGVVGSGLHGVLLSNGNRGNENSPLNQFRTTLGHSAGAMRATRQGFTSTPLAQHRANHEIGALATFSVGAGARVRQAERFTVVKDAPTSTNSVISNLTNGVLVVRGTTRNDNILVDLVGINVKVRNKTYQLSKITSVVVDADSGNDTITIDSALAKRTIIYGGLGNDTILGGKGVDEIYAGGGSDVVNSRGGNDVIFGGTETDKLNGNAGNNKVVQGSPKRVRSMTSFELQVFNLTNKERVSRGLSALKIDTRLAKAASVHSSNMAKRTAQSGLAAGVDHSLWGVSQPTVLSRLDYVGFEWMTFGENVAGGQRTAQEVVQAWMNSAGHRANILSANFTKLGVGAIRLSNGSYTFTQNFG